MTYIDENQLLEYLRSARDYFDAKDFEAAYRACQQALNLDSTNEFANKTILKAAKEIRKARKKELKRRINDLQSLWDLKEYDKLLTEYEALDKFYPEYPPVLFQIARLKTLSREQKEKASSKYKKEIKKNIKTLHKDGKFMETINAIEQIKPYFEGESWPDDLMQKVKHDYVIEQLKSRKELLEHQEYERLYKFLTKLYQIFPEARIKKYIDQTENLILENRKYEKSVFIEDSLDFINSLYNQGKYEESMQVCEELLSLTGESNLKAKKFYSSARKSNEKEMNVKIKEMMIEKNKNLNKQYLEAPENFVKI
ncbi:MAG: hypothetical protein Q8P68_02465 [Candidatus Peregrinibacteria bacterium]|nr:hypothetical protein [Candidatus Peregrinibacteria bacterium]MDZ4245106.1 hypothetical protein [Candidatus Gracilibacteria bacterium]